MKKAIFMSFLLFATLFSLSLSLPKVSATSIPSILTAVDYTPINTTIPVISNEIFVLRYKFVFDASDVGFFALTFYWDNNETDPNGPYFNFTYQGFVVKFTDGTDFTVPVNATIMKGSAPGLPGVYRYSVTIDESYGESKNGAFWVNITMRAAGLVGGSYFPRVGGNASIICSSTYIAEASIILIPEGTCTIYVKPRVMASDSAGVPKKIFNATRGEIVYAKGFGFVSKASGIRLIVRPNATWVDGKLIGTDIRVPLGGNYNTTSASLNGTFLVRLGTLPVGDYDMVADTDRNNRYNEAIDAVDDATEVSGIVVIPEFPYGTAILAMIATLVAVMVVLRVRNRKPSLLPLF